MDATAVFEAIKNGGPSVIFLLVVFVTLLLTGHIRPTGSVKAERAAMELAHKAELDARDRQIAELVRMQERLTDRMDRNQELFGESLSLIRQEMMPMLRTALGPAKP